MKLKIYRGTNQIGGNIIEVATDKTKIILDCGKNLPPLEYDKGTIKPDEIDIPGLTSGDSAYDGVFISHYHADHCGLIDKINDDIPVYASTETKMVLNIISDFIDSKPPRISKTLKCAEKERVGDITVLPLYVRHSAKGAMTFLIEADGKKMLYTGDFNNIDRTYYELIKDVDILLCEGTNIESTKNGKSEEDIRRDAAEIMRETQNHVFVLCSTTNIVRVRAIEDACRKTGRTMAVDPFMNAVLERVSERGVLICNKVGYLPYYIDKEKSPRIHKYFAEDRDTFDKTDAVAKMTQLTFMVRETMGEFMKNLDRRKTLRGSTLIYSMWEGYKVNGRTRGFLNLCEAMGIKVVDLHASGHAYREQIRYAVDRINPKTLIPIHTESREAFTEICENVKVINDNEIYEI